MTFHNINFPHIDTNNQLRQIISKVTQPIGRAVTTAAAQIKQVLKKSKHINPDEFYGKVLIAPQEIESHSLINCPKEIDLEGLNPFQSDRHHEMNKVAAGIMADGLVAIGGGNASYNFPVWEWLLESFGKSLPNQTADEAKVIFNLKNGLTQLKEFYATITSLFYASDEQIHSKATEIAQTIKNLKKNESYLMTGGWSDFGGEAGHMIIYEFRRKMDGHLDILIYSSTVFPGVIFYRSDDKDRYYPLIRYSQVPDNVIFNDDDGKVRSGFIQSLIETKVLPSKDKNLLLGARDVSKIFNFLSLYRVRDERKGLKTPQRGPTCVPSSIKFWLRCNSAHLGVYKQLLFHVKLKLLVAFFHTAEKYLLLRTENAQTTRDLLKIIAHKTLRRVVKLTKNVHGYGALITSELALQARATAHDILLRVAEAEEKIKEQERQETEPADILKAETQKQRTARQTKCQDAATIQTVKPEKVPFFNLSYRLETANSAKFLQGFVDALQAFQETKDGHLWNTHIHYLVDQLPMPQDTEFWKNLSVEELEEVQKHICQLLDHYQKHYTKDALERRYATVLPLYTLIHALSLLIDEKKYSHQGDASIGSYAVPDFNKYLYLDGLKFSDKNEFDRIKKAQQYFDTFNKQPQLNEPLFNVDCSEKTKKLRKVVRYKVSKAPGNSKYWEALMQSDPGLRDKLLPSQKPMSPNLAEDTQIALQLEDYAATPLLDFGYSHVHYLRHAIAMSHLFVRKVSNSNFHFGPQITSDDRRGFLLNTPIKYDEEEALSLFADKKYPPLIAGEHQSLVKEEVAKRENKQWVKASAEARVLKKHAANKGVVAKLTRTLSQPTLTAHQMIYELNRNIKSLADLSLQSLTYRLFLRSPYNEKGDIELGLGGQICHDEALAKNAASFIHNGLNHYLHADLNLNGVRFFLTLSFFLCRYLTDARLHEKANKFNHLALIDKWLEKRNLSDTQKNELHFFRVLFSGIKPSLTQKEYSKAFSSWIIYKFSPSSNSHARMPLLDELSVRFMSKMASDIFYDHQIKDKEAFFQPFCRDIIKVIGIENKAPAASWIVEKDLGIPYLSNGQITINLASGQVYNDHGLIDGFDNTLPWEKSQAFNRLFSKQKAFSYTPCGGGGVEFTYLNNKYRVIPQSFFGYVIQRKFLVDGKGDIWFSLQQDTKECPALLANDFALWVSTDDTLSEITGVFTKRHSHKITHVLTHEGVIVQSKGNTTVPDKHGYELDKFEGDNFQGIEPFESESGITIYRKDNKIKTVAFSRYASLDGNTLVFETKGDALLWSENRAYCLPKEKRANLLGNYTHYLYLQSVKKQNEGIVLVPLKVIIDRYVNNNIEPPTFSPLATWKGSQKYLAYKVDKGVITPTNLESKLYLAYIYLSQTKYEEAAKLLRSIKASESLSTTSVHILKAIQEYEKNTKNPNFRMVQLLALLLSMKKREQGADTPVENHFDQNVIGPDKVAKWFIILFDRLNNILDDCSLTTGEEFYLLNQLLNTKLTIPDYEIGRLKRRKEYLEQPNAVRKTEERIYNHAPIPDLVNKVRWVNENLEGKSEDITKEIAWLKLALTEQNPPPVYYPFLQKTWQIPTTETNGRLFLDIYRLAKEGNKEDKNEMRYRLYLWREREYHKEYVDCLFSILRDAHLYPPLIHKDASDEEIYAFLKEVTKAYSGVPKGAPFTPPFFEKQNPNDEIFHYNKVFGEVFKKQEIDINNTGGIRDPIPLTLSAQEERWEILGEWKKKYIKETPTKPDSNSYEFTFSLNENLLSNREATYKAALEKDLAELTADYGKGKEINLAVTQKDISEENCSVLSDVVTLKLEKLRDTRLQIESQLLLAANKVKYDSLQKQSHLATIGGKARKGMEIQDCIDCLLSNDRRSYCIKNPALSQEDVKEIASLTMRLVDIKSYEMQLDRIQKMLINISKQAQGTSHRSSLCQRLSNELEARCHFEDNPSDTRNFTEEEKLILHIFSGQTGIIPHRIQIDRIKSLLEYSEKNPERFKDTVMQLMMGGGKTSVIALILLYLAARRKGRMGYFIVPPSLFDTVVANMGESMFKAFGKDILAINMERNDFTTFKLKRLRQDLENAEKNNTPIIINAGTLQGLELEFFSVCFKIRDANESLHKIQKQIPRLKQATLVETYENKIEYIKDDIKNLFEKGKEISKIIKRGKVTADSILDEIDILLDSLFAINYIDGEKIPVESVKNQMLLEINKALNSKMLKATTLPDEPLLRDVVRLQSNQQYLLSEDDYIHHIAPVVAKHLTEKFTPLSQKLGAVFFDSFVRYASGQIPEVLQTYADEGIILTPEMHQKEKSLKSIPLDQLQQDLAFLLRLESLYKGEEKEKEAANLAALAKHFLQDLLPAAFLKMGGRNYGYSPKTEQAGKIIPFLGVQAPATTEFGYHWMAGQLQYQAGAAFKPEPSQITMIANAATKAAHYYMERNGETFEETAEYIDFKELFGIPLDMINEPGMLEKAIEIISNDPDKILEMQYELVALYATYSSRRLSSNGLALLDLLCTARGMAGIPWNWEGYDKRMAERFIAEEGTLGRIFHKMAERCKGKKNSRGEANEGIYEIDFRETDLDNPYTLKEFLTTLYAEHSDPYKIRGIIEGAGTFKNFGTNANVAKDWIEFIQQRQQEEENLPDDKKTVDPRIEGVLFFHKDPSQTQPNTLYVWRKGASRPDKVGGTTNAALKAKGLNPANYVIYFDDMHTTGTDIEQLDGATNILTLGPNMSARDMAQNFIRARKYLMNQDVDIVVTKDSRKKMVNEGRTLNDMALQVAKYQSIRKTQAMVIHFTQQINHLLRRHSSQKLFDSFDTVLGANAQQFVADVNTYEPYIVSFFKEEPYLQFGKLAKKINTQQMLLNMLKMKVQQFKENVNDEEIVQKVEENAAQLEEWIKKTQCLPENWDDFAKFLDQDQQVEIKIDVDVNEDVHLEVDHDLLTELQGYERGHQEEVRSERGITLDAFMDMTKALRDGKPNVNCISLKKQLEDCPDYYHNKVRMPYEKVFSQPLYGTHGYFYPLESSKILPVFHTMQRPANQLLVVRNEKTNQLQWVMLSEFEAGQAKEYLEDLYKNSEEPLHVWLVQPDGTLMASGPAMGEFLHADRQVLKALVEVNAFNGNIDALDNDLLRAELEAWLDRNKEIKYRYLLLKTFNDPLQKYLLSTCPLFSNENSKKTDSLGLFKSKTRQQREKMQLGTYDPKKTWDNPNDYWRVKLLDPKESILRVQNLRVEYVQYLGIDWNRQDEHTKRAIEELRKKYPDTDDETLKAHIRELNKRQFEYLKEFHFAFVTADQIQWIEPENIPFIQLPGQIHRLDSAGNIEYLLSKAQVKALTPEQAHLIPYVDSVHYKTFSSDWQVGAVPNEKLMYLHATQAPLLNKSQVNYLIAQYKSSEGLQDDQQMYKKLIDNFHPKQYGWFKSNDIGLIPAHHLGEINQEKVEQITDPATIKQLEEIAAKNGAIPKGQWTSWISPAMVSSISNDQVAFLKKPEQIANLSEALLICITDKQFQDLTKTQLLAMSKSHPNWEKLKNSITEKQFATFDDGKYFEIVPEALFKKYIKAPQVPYLSSKKTIRWCSYELVKNFTAKQAKQVSADQVPHMYGREVVKAIPLKERYIHKLTKKQFASISLEQGALLTVDQIHQMNKKEEIKNVPDSRLHELKTTQVRYVESKARIQKLPCKAEYIKEVAADSIKHLSVDQIKVIDLKQIQYLEGPEQIQAVPLDKEYVQKLTKRQFKHMSDEQIALISKEQLQNLDAAEDLARIPLDRIPEIKPSQARLIEGKERIQAIPCDKIYIEKLSKSQIKDLTAEQVKLLSPAQILFLDKAEEVALLQKDQWRHLSKEGIAAMGEEQVKTLLQEPSLKDKIGLIHPAYLHLVNNQGNVDHISNEQVRQFGSAGFNVLADKHPLWNRITDDMVNEVTLDKLRNIPKNKLCLLDKPAAINALDKSDFVHLKKQQLLQKKPLWSLTYTIGVLVLGVAACIVTAVAECVFVAAKLYDATVAESWRQKFELRMEIHRKRLYHLFSDYLPACVA